MSNLEQLTLYLTVDRQTRFIEGNDLQEHVINYMPQLEKFLFNIHSTIVLNNQTNLLSNEDVANSLKDISYKKTISCVNYFFETNNGQCHIYSYPFTMTIYENLANNFPNGLFTCVREVSLYDEYPFEYKFFLQVAQSFPLMEILTITNSKAQKNKRCNTNENLPIINYHSLQCLTIDNSHDDYLEQFLVNTKTCLPDNVRLFVDYKSLKRVTKKLTRKTTRINCAKMRYLCFNRVFRLPKYFQDYFRDITIDSM